MNQIVQVNHCIFPCCARVYKCTITEKLVLLKNALNDTVKILLNIFNISCDKMESIHRTSLYKLSQEKHLCCCLSCGPNYPRFLVGISPEEMTDR